MKPSTVEINSIISGGEAINLNDPIYCSLKQYIEHCSFKESLLLKIVKSYSKLHNAAKIL